MLFPKVLEELLMLRLCHHHVEDLWPLRHLVLSVVLNVDSSLEIPKRGGKRNIVICFYAMFFLWAFMKRRRQNQCFLYDVSPSSSGYMFLILVAYKGQYRIVIPIPILVVLELSSSCCLDETKNWNTGFNFQFKFQIYCLDG